MPPRRNPDALTRELREYAHSRGVDLVGCTSPAPFVVGDAAEEVSPEKMMPGVRSIVVAACHTYGADSYRPSRSGVPRGRLGPWTRVSVPAYGHIAHVISEFLTGRGYRAAAGHDLPLKATAVRAGIACYGKNSIVHADGAGSYLELMAVLTDADLTCTDRPVHTSDCPDGCQACMDACPTGALAEPFRLTHEQCVSHYLWGAPIPREHREKVGDLIFRCGVCQQACPRNQGLRPRAQFPFSLQSGDDSPTLIPLLLGDEAYYQQAIPEFVRQAGPDTIRRNAAIAAGNVGDPAAVPALTECFGVPHALTRVAAAWALGRLGGAEATRTLGALLRREENGEVREEAERALGQ